MSDVDKRAVRQLEAAYLALLRMPVGKLRLSNQKLLSGCREALAQATGKTSQEVQDEYEQRALLEAPPDSLRPVGEMTIEDREVVPMFYSDTPHLPAGTMLYAEVS